MGLFFVDGLRDGEGGRLPGPAAAPRALPGLPTVAVLKSVGAEQFVSTSPDPAPPAVPLRRVGDARRRSS